jgi:hypothetical protein
VRVKPEQVLEESRVAARRLLSSTSRPTPFSFLFINIAANHKSDAENVSRRVDSKGHRRMPGFSRKFHAPALAVVL